MSLKESNKGSYGRVTFNHKRSLDGHDRGVGERWYGKQVYKDPKLAAHRRAKNEINRPKPTWLESLTDHHRVSINKRDFGGPGF